jgi:hypothetical protein
MPLEAAVGDHHERHGAIQGIQGIYDFLFVGQGVWSVEGFAPWRPIELLVPAEERAWRGWSAMYVHTASKVSTLLHWTTS